MVRTMIVIEPDIRAERWLRARSPRTVSVTYCDGLCGPGLGCRGTTRGTSTGRIPAQCVLSVRPRVASVPVERSWRSTGPLLIRGFRIRAPGAPPAKTSLVDHQLEPQEAEHVADYARSAPCGQRHQPARRSACSRAVCRARLRGETGGERDVLQPGSGRPASHSRPSERCCWHGQTRVQP
jgi:hypothetical protein